jgi:hypothetical protein
VQVGADDRRPLLAASLDSLEEGHVLRAMRQHVRLMWNGEALRTSSSVHSFRLMLGFKASVQRLAHSERRDKSERLERRKKASTHVRCFAYQRVARQEPI